MTRRERERVTGEESDQKREPIGMDGLEDGPGEG